MDIGNSGRAPTDVEITKYGLELFKWAIDGVGIVVNPANKAKALTRDQLKAVYAGRIVNWKDNDDVRNQMATAIEDAVLDSGVNMPFEVIDKLIGDILDIALKRLPNEAAQ